MRTLENDPIWVRIADPNVFAPVVSRVNTRPIRYNLGTDSFRSDPISCKWDLSELKKERGRKFYYIESSFQKLQIKTYFTIPRPPSCTPESKIILLVKCI